MAEELKTHLAELAVDAAEVAVLVRLLAHTAPDPDRPLGAELARFEARFGNGYRMVVTVTNGAPPYWEQRLFDAAGRECPAQPALYGFQSEQQLKCGDELYVLRLSTATSELNRAASRLYAVVASLAPGEAEADLEQAGQVLRFTVAMEDLVAKRSAILSGGGVLPSPLQGFGHPANVQMAATQLALLGGCRTQNGRVRLMQPLPPGVAEPGSAWRAQLTAALEFLPLVNLPRLDMYAALANSLAYRAKVWSGSRQEVLDNAYLFSTPGRGNWQYTPVPAQVLANICRKLDVPEPG